MILTPKLFLSLFIVSDSISTFLQLIIFLSYSLFLSLTSTATVHIISETNMVFFCVFLYTFCGFELVLIKLLRFCVLCVLLLKVKSMAREENSVPEWLEILLGETKFFTPCSIHLSSKKNEKTFFCLCCRAAICFSCFSSHPAHALLQVLNLST